MVRCRSSVSPPSLKSASNGNTSSSVYPPSEDASPLEKDSDLNITTDTNVQIRSFTISTDVLKERAFALFFIREKNSLLAVRPKIPANQQYDKILDKWNSLSAQAKATYYNVIARSAAIHEQERQRSQREVNVGFDGIRARVAEHPIYRNRVRRNELMNPDVRPSLIRSFSSPKDIYFTRKESEQPNASLASPLSIPKVNPTVSASIADALGLGPLDALKMNANPIPSMANTFSCQTSSGTLNNKKLVVHHAILPVQFNGMRLVQKCDSLNDVPVYTPIDSSLPGIKSSGDALDLYYTSLCEPAFPFPGTTPDLPFTANRYYDGYQSLLLKEFKE